MLLLGLIALSALIVALVALDRSRSPVPGSLEKRTADLERELSALHRRVRKVEGERAESPLEASAPVEQAAAAALGSPQHPPVLPLSPPPALPPASSISAEAPPLPGAHVDLEQQDRKSTRLNSSHSRASRMPSSA